MKDLVDDRLVKRVYSIIDRLVPANGVEKSFFDGRIVLTVGSADTAERIRIGLEIRNVAVEVLIFIRGNQLIYACVKPGRRGDNIPSSLREIMQATDLQSDWVTRVGEATLQLIEQTVIIYQAQRDRGYPVIAVKPQYTTKRLYTQNLVGAPLMEAPEGIKEPRLELIEELEKQQDGVVLESGYNYFWDGFEWQFTLKAFKYESEFVFSIADREGCWFQRDYWRLRQNS